MKNASLKKLLSLLLTLVMLMSMLPVSSFAESELAENETEEAVVESALDPEPDKEEDSFALSSADAEQDDPAEDEQGQTAFSEEAGSTETSTNLNSVTEEKEEGASDETVEEQLSETEDEEDPAEEAENGDEDLEAEGSIIDSGSCGSSVYWTLYKTGKLVLDGWGTMRDYDYVSYDKPWSDYLDKITTVEVSGITNIGKAAFYDCPNLTKVTLSHSITKIGVNAFAYCNKLEDLTLPFMIYEDDVLVIGDYAFANCSSLTRVVLPDSVSEIADGLFSNCYALEEVVIPRGVTSIGAQAFIATNLKSVTIPASVETIYTRAFADCRSLTDITFEHTTDDPLEMTWTEGWYGLISCFEVWGDTLKTKVHVADPENYNAAIRYYDWEEDGREITNLKDRIPIIIIPGIMGSKLYEDPDCSDLFCVWGTYLSILGKSSQRLDINNTLYTTGLAKVSGDDGADEYGTLDTYKNMVNFLRNQYPKRDIYFFSYDWRHSNADSAFDLAYALSSNNIRRAVFICHSMGGLVMSQYVANYSFAVQTVDKVITLGTPYEGATRLMQAVMTPNTLDPDGGILYDFANMHLFYGQLSFDLKRNLPGVGELTPAPAYWQYSNVTNRVYSGTPTRDEANTLRLDVFIPTGGTIGLSSLLGWATKEFSLSKAEKAAKKQTLQWLADLETDYSNRNLRMAGVVFSSSLGKTTIVPSYYVPISYNEFLQNLYGDNYSAILSAMETAEKGFSTLQRMPNAYFAIGDTDTKRTMSGITIVGMSPVEYNYLSIGDGTVPLASANMLNGGAKARTRYFNLDHGGLAGDKNPKEWADVKRWIAGIIDGNGSVSAGRESPKLPKGYKLIRAACPVDIIVSYNGETLSSIEGNCSFETSFGTMDLAGENGEIKIFCLDADVDAAVAINGTGSGTMDYSILEYDSAGNLLDERSIDELVITENTAIQTNSDLDGPTVLSVDEDGDGVAEKTVVLLPSGYTGEAIRLEQEYLMLAAPKEGMTAEPVSLTAVTAYPVLSDLVQWGAADENGIELPEENPVITVSENGLVTPLRAGIAYVYAWVECGTQSYYARCRVDVVDSSETSGTPIADDLNGTGRDGLVNGVTLLDTKATVELFKTDYTRIRIVPNLSRNQNQSIGDLIDEDDIPTPDLEGIGAIRRAEFIEDGNNTDVSKYFALRVVDDRTLEIVPTLDALTDGNENSKALKNSYKVAIRVTVEEPGGTSTFDTSVLTFSVKKTLPTVKAAAVKLNSYIPGDSAELAFTGGSVTAVEGDKSVIVRDMTLAERDGRTIRLPSDGPVKGSGKLNLLVTLDGWTIKRPVTVSVSVASTAPKLSVKPSSLTVKPKTRDTATAALNVTPTLFATADYPITILRVEETVGKTVVTYENEEESSDGAVFLNSASLNCGITDGILQVAAGKALDDSRAHNFKVWLRVGHSDFSVPVKTLVAKNAVKLAVKASGSIDTAISESPITLKPTLSNFHTGGGEEYAVRIVEYDSKAKWERDITYMFNVSYGGSDIRVTLKEDERSWFTQEANCVYYAVVSADYGAEDPVETRIKLTVKWSDPAKVPVTVTMKAKGAIDVIRDGSAITLEPTVKNCYAWDIADTELVFYYKEGSSYLPLAEEASPFLVQKSSDGFSVTLKEGVTVNHKSDKFFAKLTVVDKNDPERVSTTKAFTALSLKMGAAKLTQSVKEVQLLKRDRYSRGEISIRTNDATLNGISRVVFADSNDVISKDERFTLVDLGGGDFAIQYAGNKLPDNLKSATVKLKVYLAGNETATPNATLSVKINIV